VNVQINPNRIRYIFSQKVEVGGSNEVSDLADTFSTVPAYIRGATDAEGVMLLTELPPGRAALTLDRDSGRRVEIASVDQSVRLLNASHGQYPLSDEVAAEGGGIWAAFEGKTADAMWEIIWRADKRKRQINADEPAEDEIAGLGILQGDLEDHGPTREWKFGDGQVTWDAIVEMASRTRAPDFELEPLDREDGNHARFHTHYPRMGANRRDEVVLEYGVNTSPDFGYEPATVDLCNRYALVGKEKRGQARVYVAENRMSMRLYGVWQRDETTNTRDWAKLEDRAHEYVAKRAF